MRLIRFHDGGAFRSGIELEPGRKLRHILVADDTGVKIANPPLTERVEVLGEIKARHVRIFRRLAKNFGASKAALTALKEITL